MATWLITLVRSYLSADEPVTRCLSGKAAVLEPAGRHTHQVEPEETLYRLSWPKNFTYTGRIGPLKALLFL